ncbi:MAG: S41 family peptidase [Armatimonadetes bacterium]|nr:S41 family peptidase [Armatimonadota bacterium]
MAILLITLSVLLSSPFCCFAAGDTDPLKDEIITREQRIIGLATVHAAVKQHFAYLERLTEASWDKAFEEYLPQVEKQQSLYDYYRALQRFIALLEDGHTNVYFPPSVQQALDRLPIRLDVVEGRWVVADRVPTEEIIKEDIPPGSVLESIEGKSPDKYFADKFYPFIAAGREQAKREILSVLGTYPKNARVKMVFRYPDGSSHERVLLANRKTTKWTDDLHAKYTLGWRYGPGFSFSEPEPGILYIAFRSCDSESETKVVELLESRSSNWPKGVILDLRANQGGSTPVPCVQHLISKPVRWREFSSRWSMSYMDARVQDGGSDAASEWLKERGLPERFSPGWYKVTGEDTIAPADDHYDGPLAILTGPATGSATEDLVVLLQQAGRGKVIGDRTNGSTGQPFYFDLPGGGKGRVNTCKVCYADGREFIGVGCEPDITVTPTIKGIAEGRDEVLEAALGYLRAAAR